MGKGRVRDRAEYLPMPKRYYHWYDEAKPRGLGVDRERLEELRREFESKDLATRISEEERQKLLQSFDRGARGGHMRVDKLLEICKALDIRPDYLE